MVVPPAALVGHTDPGVRVVKLTIKQPSFTPVLFGTEQVLEAAVGLRHCVRGALVLAAGPVVQVDFILNDSLQNIKIKILFVTYTYFIWLYLK